MIKISILAFTMNLLASCKTAQNASGPQLQSSDSLVQNSAVKQSGGGIDVENLLSDIKSNNDNADGTGTEGFTKVERGQASQVTNRAGIELNSGSLKISNKLGTGPENCEKVLLSLIEKSGDAKSVKSQKLQFGTLFYSDSSNFFVIIAPIDVFSEATRNGDKHGRSITCFDEEYYQILVESM